MTALVINTLGLLLMVAITWWFWLYRPAAAVQPDAGVVQIKVKNGVYSPDHIRVPANQSTTLRFLRQDPSACAATIIFDGLDISAELPLDEIKEILIPPSIPGIYSFNCQMNTYKGSLEVTDT